MEPACEKGRSCAAPPFLHSVFSGSHSNHRRGESARAPCMPLAPSANACRPAGAQLRAHRLRRREASSRRSEARAARRLGRRTGLQRAARLRFIRAPAPTDIKICIFGLDKMRFCAYDLKHTKPMCFMVNSQAGRRGRMGRLFFNMLRHNFRNGRMHAGAASRGLSAASQKLIF